MVLHLNMNHTHQIIHPCYLYGKFRRNKHAKVAFYLWSYCLRTYYNSLAEMQD